MAVADIQRAHAQTKVRATALFATGSSRVPAQFSPFTPPSDVQFIIPPSLSVPYTLDWKPGRTMSWNLTVEREIVQSLVVRAGYVGSKGTHLSNLTDLCGINV